MSPLVGFTVATVVVDVDHVPPGVACVAVAVDPTQVESDPVIGPGVVTTFTVVVTAHPLRR